MNDIQVEKIKKFINDKQMNEAVYSALLDSFLDDKIINDVNILAASRLSINFLREAWKNLEKYKQAKEEESPPTGNVGL